MNVEKMTVAIRMRKAWEAVDLGISMAQRWFVPLFLIWLMVALPAFIAISLLPIDLAYAAIIFWWLKPLYEKPMMHYLSRALFGEFPDLKTFGRSLWSILKPNLLKETTLWRPSLSRSVKMPVSLLEGLTGNERAARLSVLTQGQQGSTQWMTIVFTYVEMFLAISILTLMYFFIPERWVEYFDIMSILLDPPTWLSRLYSFCYFFAVGLVAPFFVACGFALYIRRRTELEGWDIELQFKQLANTYRKHETDAGIETHPSVDVVSQTVMPSSARDI